MVVSADNNAAPVDEKPQPQQDTLSTLEFWSEPHPGVSVSTEAHLGLQATGGTSCDGVRGDMAAKGCGHWRLKCGANRRCLRPIRMRTTRPSRGLVAQRSRDEEESIVTVSLTEEKTTFTEPCCIERMVSNCSSNYPIVAIEVTDDETSELSSVSTIRPARQSRAPSPCRPMSLDWSAFSSHVDDALSSRQSNASSLTVYDQQAHCRAAPEQDVYGWDAELDRKMLTSRALRRPKRNLWQRVFGLGDGGDGRDGEGRGVEDLLQGSTSSETGF